MPLITQLRRTLENAGYVEVTPRNEELASDYLMYVNNVDGTSKHVTISANSSGSFDRDPNTTYYNENVLVSGGNNVSAHISSGEYSGDIIIDPEVLQRVVRIEYLDADKEFADSDIAFFYKDGIWYQGSRPSYKTIMKRNGFDGLLNVRVHYPRIVSGCKLCIQSSSVIATSDLGERSNVTKSNTQYFDLGMENLLGGYIDVQVRLFDNMDDAKAKVSDKKTDWHGSYMPNIISVTLDVSIVNEPETISSPVLSSHCRIFYRNTYTCLRYPQHSWRS